MEFLGKHSYRRGLGISLHTVTSACRGTFLCKTPSLRVGEAVIQVGTYHKEYAVSLVGTFGDKPSLRHVEEFPVEADIRVQTQYMGACSLCYDGTPKSVIDRRRERGPYHGQVPSA